MDWNPTFFFDQEPDWKRLAGLHPDACLIGQQHRNGKLWYLHLTLDDLPPEYHHLQLSGFPCDFTVPDDLPLSPENKEFIERVGTVASITGVLPAGVLQLGVVIATLAGVRTLVVEDPWGAEYAVQPGQRSFISSRVNLRPPVRILPWSSATTAIARRARSDGSAYSASQISICLL